MSDLGTTARELARRGNQINDLPVLSRVSEASALAGDVAAFMVDLADRVDGLRPYLDEARANGGA